MDPSRREFLKLVGAVSAAGVSLPATASASAGAGSGRDGRGMLTDLSVCIGCRKCEFACQDVNGLPHPPLEAFEDTSVFEQKRSCDPGRFTVVNRYDQERLSPPGAAARTPEPRWTNGHADSRPAERPATVHVKTQCMHCNQPACASACPVAALRKTPEGPVIYEASLCIGCRYCLMACPFSIPAYTYDRPFTPVVQKCSMCFERITQEGGVPACAKICPVEAITFGSRGELLSLAREKRRNHPERYVDHIYGEHEVGGTSWLYLSPRPFGELGFRTDLGTRACPERTAGFLSLVPLVVSIWPAVLLGAHALTKGHRRPPPENGQPAAEGGTPAVVTPAPVAAGSVHESENPLEGA